MNIDITRLETVRAKVEAACGEWIEIRLRLFCEAEAEAKQRLELVMQDEARVFVTANNSPSNSLGEISEAVRTATRNRRRAEDSLRVAAACRAQAEVIQLSSVDKILEVLKILVG